MAAAVGVELMAARWTTERKSEEQRSEGGAWMRRRVSATNQLLSERVEEERGRAMRGRGGERLFAMLMEQQWKSSAERRKRRARKQLFAQLDQIHIRITRRPCQPTSLYLYMNCMHFVVALEFGHGKNSLLSLPSFLQRDTRKRGEWRRRREVQAKRGRRATRGGRKSTRERR